MHRDYGIIVELEGDERAHLYFFINEEMKAGVSLVLDVASNIRLEFSTVKPSSIENPDDTLMCITNSIGRIGLSSLKNRGMIQIDNNVEKYADWIWDNEIDPQLKV